MWLSDVAVAVEPGRKKMLKRFVCVAIAVTMFSVCACGGEPYVNYGVEEYINSQGSSRTFDDGYVNHGTATAMGDAVNSSGIYVDSGGFSNSGTVTTRGNTIDSNGISIGDDGFSNSGTVTAMGNGGRGIYTFSSDFSNTGTVTATGDGNGVGINVGGGFSNTGTVIAASNANSWGIYISSKGFSNSGVLTLGNGNSASVQMRNDSNNDMKFLSGSSLALDGGYIDMMGSDTRLLVEPGTQLFALNAPQTNGVSITYAFFQNLHNLNGTGGVSETALQAAFNVSPDGPVLAYQVMDTGGGTYEVQVTRNGLASSYASSGAAGQFVAQLESSLAGQPVNDVASPYYNYALLRGYIDSQPTGQGVQAAAGRAARERTPQATAGALTMLSSAARMAPDILKDRLFGAYTAGRDGEAGARQALSGAAGSAYASFDASSCGRGLVVWASPFYHQGRFDAETDSGYSDLKEKITGISAGVAASRGGWSLGAAGHYLYADVDGGDDYYSRSHGYGVSLGAGRGFDLGSLNPWISLTAGYTHFDMKQTRRESLIFPGGASSRPNVDVFTAGVTASNRFDFGSFRLTPELGADYAHTDTSSYHESAGLRATPLRVSAQGYDSLRGIVGARAEWRLPKCVTIEMRGFYRHEFLDKRAGMDWQDASGLPVGGAVDSRDVGRSSGVLGAGVKWCPASRITAAVDYDLYLGRRYLGHRVTANVGMAF